MSELAGIQENDVVVTKVGPQYWVWQQIGKSRKRLDGPYDDLMQAESRAKVEGSITTDNVVALAAQGIAAGDLAAALRAIAQGEGYANVHSTMFPAGEIRGQVRVRGHLDTDEDD